MKRLTFWLILIFVVSTVPFLAEARVGGGRSSGSRGSRSSGGGYRPSSPSQNNNYNSNRSAPPGNPYGQPPSQSGGWMRSLGAGMAGGFLGSMLFGGMSHAGGMGAGGGGGMGPIEILLLLGLGFFAYRYFKSRRPAAAVEGNYNSNSNFNTYSNAAPPMEENSTDLLRRVDPQFNEEKFRNDRTDDFFRFQAAWGNRDLSPVQSAVTSEMNQILSNDLQNLKNAGQINRLDNIAVRSVDIDEAWEEAGRVYATVRFTANLVDYTVEEKTNQVVAGSRTEPVKFQEHWTFTRDANYGSAPWQLSAIQQDA